MTRATGNRGRSMRRWWTAGVAVILLVVIVSLVVRGHSTARVAVTPSPSATQLPKATTAPPAAVATTPTPAPSPATSSDGAISITAPGAGGTVTSGTIVSGTATPGTTVYLRLKGGKSGQLFYGSTTVDSTGSYSLELAFTNQVTGGSDTGALEAFTLDSSGAETDPVTIQVGISG